MGFAVRPNGSGKLKSTIVTYKHLQGSYTVNGSAESDFDTKIVVFSLKLLFKV